MAGLPQDVREKDADGIKRAHAAKTHKATKDALAWVFGFMIENKLGVDVINFLNRRGDITLLNDIADAGMWRLKEWYAS